MNWRTSWLVLAVATVVAFVGGFTDNYVLLMVGVCGQAAVAAWGFQLDG